MFWDIRCGKKECGHLLSIAIAMLEMKRRRSRRGRNCFMCPSSPEAEYLGLDLILDFGFWLRVRKGAEHNALLLFYSHCVKKSYHVYLEAQKILSGSWQAPSPIIVQEEEEVQQATYNIARSRL